MVRWFIGVGFLGTVAAVAVLLTWGVVARDRAAAAHTPMHIGCRHHNHGPKWFADHGKILGQPGAGALRSRLAAEPDDLSRRSMTAGRVQQTMRGED